MFVESLALKNFRNYEKLEIRFSDHINIIHGDNAQGKTNILEAIYIAATTKSHKNSKDKIYSRNPADNDEIQLKLLL